MTEVTLLERFKGAMVGVHVGDSIGAPYETWGPQKIATDIEARGGLKFFDYKNTRDQGPEDIPAGSPTDDSDQTADLAYSLIECNGLDTAHLREALRDSVIYHKSRLWDGESFGAGGTTRKALSDNPKLVEQAMQNNIGTNGSLMRCTPMSLWLYGHVRKGNIMHRPYDLTSQMSEVTHYHDHSKEACREFSYALWLILDGIEKIRITEVLQAGGSRQSRIGPRIGLLLKDGLCYPYDPGAWPARGTAEFSLYVALWCFLHSNSFEEGIEKAVRIGGDTDTYAAIAGGLLGAYYGYDAIPPEWRQTILGHDVMVDYAEKLYSMNQKL